MRIKEITIAEVQYAAYRLATETMQWNEPIPDFESRFPHILESCVNAPFQTFGQKVLYPGLIKKAAILFYLMIKNHPFENGNKRIAMATLFVFLARNKKWLKVDTTKLYNFAKRVAGSKPIYKDRVLERIEKFFKLHIVGV